MNRDLAILAAGSLVATAILITNHWEIVLQPGDLAHIVRLNRWTGAADICWPDPATIKAERSLAGAKYRCADPSQTANTNQGASDQD
jgi:hypothetical protein